MNDEDLRDLFAGLALQGLLKESTNDFNDQAIAELAYSLADAMLEAKYSRPHGVEQEEGIAKIKKRTRKPKSEQL